jgi:hypothetical protein
LPKINQYNVVLIGRVHVLLIRGMFIELGQKISARPPHTLSAIPERLPSG